jgi:heme/copper-type cytochrome/quinol oxidase subunit 2
MIDDDDFWSNWWNENWQGNRSTRRKSAPAPQTRTILRKMTMTMMMMMVVVVMVLFIFFLFYGASSATN